MILSEDSDNEVEIWKRDMNRSLLPYIAAIP